MTEETKAFWGGVGFGVLALSLLLMLVPGSAFREVHKKKNACEALLPRNQQCVMVYVPEKQK